jgi:hypothetical protein
MGPVGPIGATGATGATGPPLSFQGTWSSTTAYSIGDAVYLNGRSYIAVTGNLNVTPGTDGSVWALLAQQGATGPIGATGATGATGPTGPTGAAGPMGATGNTGPAGATGANGAQGIQGLQGPAGATGPAGAQGATGPGISFKGAWNGATPYLPGDAVYYVGGASYVALTANTNVLPFTNPSVWSMLASPGATGPTGATGANGAPGTQGPPGLTGAAGATGATGATGSTSLASFQLNALFNNGNYLGTPLYYSPQLTGSGNDGGTSIAFSSLNSYVVSMGCTVSALYVGVQTSMPGGGAADNATITVYKNGSATGMSCTATTGVSVGSKGGCSTTANTFTVSAGDNLSLKLTETNFTPIVYYASTLQCQ